MRLNYKRNTNSEPIEVYADTSWGENEDRRSTSGILINNIYTNNNNNNIVI